MKDTLGMKVLFDMVIYGFNKQSDVVNRHPSFFYRNEQDSLVIHPAWGSVMTDFMDRAYQQYMRSYVLYDQSSFGNDGYHVDAASFKGPNWNPRIAYPAYRSGTASPLLMQLMQDAIRKRNKDAVLLSEVFGPVFYTVSNFGHDNQTEAMSFLIREMEQGRYTMAQYGRHIRNMYLALPKGAVRVFYARNHDTSWFYEFFGYSPLFMSMEAIHALFGVPEVFAGDPNYRFNPDDDPQVYRHYKQLFAARRRYPEFVHGERLWDAVRCNNEQVFAGMVRYGGKKSIALVSGSDRQQQVQLDLTGTIKRQQLNAMDIISETPVPVSVIQNKIQLTLQPYQVVVIKEIAKNN